MTDLKQQYIIKRIGLIDSGLGGLTILNTLIGKLSVEYIYLADTKNLPYGNKSKQELIDLAERNIEFLLSRDVDFIVVACHTLSALALESIKKKYSTIPIMGMVDPVIDFIAQQKQSKIIGVMATQATIASRYYEKRLTEIDSSLTVVSQACPLLASIIEQNYLNQSAIKKMITEYIEPLQKAGIDTLILGCTHYSLMQQYIRERFNSNVDIISADRVLNTILKNKSAHLVHEAKISFFVTGDNNNFVDRLDTLCNVAMPYLVQSVKI